MKPLESPDYDYKLHDGIREFREDSRKEIDSKNAIVTINLE